MSFPPGPPPRSSSSSNGFAPPPPPPPPFAFNGSGYPIPFTPSSTSRATSQQPSSNSNSNSNRTNMSSSSSSSTSLPFNIPTANAPPSQDLATLRKVKALIMTGQHPEYTAIIKPQALKAVSVSAAEAKEQHERAMNVKPKVIKASKPQAPTSLFRDAGDVSAVPGSSKPSTGVTEDVEMKTVDVASEGIASAAAAPASPAVVDLKNGSNSTAFSNKRDLSTAQGASSPLEDRLDDKRIKISTSDVDAPVALPLPSSASNLPTPLSHPSSKTQDTTGSTQRSPTWTPLPSIDKPTTSSSTDPAPSSGSSSTPGVSNSAAAAASLPSVESPNTKTLLERTALPQEKLVDPSTPVQSLASRIFPSPIAPSDFSSSRRQPPSEITSPSSAVSGRPPRVTAVDSWRPSSTSNPSTPTIADANPSKIDSPSLKNSITNSPTKPTSATTSALPPPVSDGSSDAKPLADDPEAKERALQLERDEIERERLRVERKLREKSAERAKYLEWEKEKELYRKKLRKERQRETEIEVEKFRLERERSSAGGSRDRGYDDFGRPNPQSNQPSLPPSNWDPRPAIDARFPPRAQPQPSDPHYVPPQSYKPAPAVYERPRPDGRPSSQLQNPRDFPPDPYYDRLPPPPAGRRPLSPPPSVRGYGGRSPSPPRGGPYRRSSSPPRRVGPYGDAGPSSRPIYRDDRDRRDGWVDDRDRAPLYDPGYRAGGPPDAYGYDRERDRFPPPPLGRRSPPPSSYGGPAGRGRSPPLSNDPAEILREMERTKEKLARLEKEAAVKRLLVPSSNGGPGGLGRAGSGGGGGGSYGGGGVDQGRDWYRRQQEPPANYRDAGPPSTVQRPYSPPRPDFGPFPPSANSNSYSYNNAPNNNNKRGPPPPPQQYPPAPARYDRYDGPPGPPRRDEPPYGAGGGGAPRRDEPPYDSRGRDPRGGDPRDRDGGARGYGPGGGGGGGGGAPLPPLRRDERDWGRR